MASSGLIGWYPLDGNTLDLSPSLRHGTLQGGSYEVDRNNLPQKALKVDALNWSPPPSTYLGDKMTIPFDTGLNTSSFTVSLWFKKTSTRRYLQTLISRFKDGPNGQPGEHFQAYITDKDTLKFQVLESTFSPTRQDLTLTGGKIQTGIWYHLAVTYTNQEARLYLNGQLISLKFKPGFNYLPKGDCDLTIGLSEQSNGPWSPFDGVIDDIGLWNRRLSTLEIQKLYNQCISPILVQPVNKTVTIFLSDTITIQTRPGTIHTWQVDSSGVFIDNLPPGLTGVQNKLTVNCTNFDLNGTKYRCITVHPSGCSDTSQVNTLKLQYLNAVKEVKPVLKIYPNPTSGEIRVEGLNRDIPYSLYTSLGSRVLTGNTLLNSVDISTLPSGVYVLEISGKFLTILKI